MSGPKSASSCYLVQAQDADKTYSLVLDLGSGAMGQLTRYIHPADVDAIVLSHTHADHCVDLVGMQVYRRWHPDGALGPVPVYCPDDDAEARMRGISGDAPDEDYRSEYDFQQVVPGQQIQIGPMTLEFFKAWHTVPALAVRITGPSETDSDKQVRLTYTGDTDLSEAVVNSATDVDLLLSEAAFQEGRDTVSGVHMTGVRAGKLAYRSGAKRLLLTHLQPWTDPVQTEADARSQCQVGVTVVAAGDVYEI
ncbi:MAG: MBL fold metallo-hydrolase [Trueperella sp.]|nr:MBL fold metallo-hydrolase [Trueperella sp.]